MPRWLRVEDRSAWTSSPASVSNGPCDGTAEQGTGAWTDLRADRFSRALRAVCSAFAPGPSALALGSPSSVPQGSRKWPSAKSCQKQNDRTSEVTR
jgi:hypothetical protein